MRRSLPIVLGVLLGSCLLAGRALAVPTLTVGDGAGAPGESFSVLAGVQDIDDIEAVLWDLAFDPDVLVPVGAVGTADFPTGWSLDASLDVTSSIFRISARRIPSQPTDRPFDGDTVEVRFRVLAATLAESTLIEVADGSSVGTVDDEFDVPFNLATRDGTVAIVPEPASALLVAGGLAALAGASRRRGPSPSR